MPKVYRGVEQFPLSGVSMRYTFDATPDAPTQKKRQYYAMLGTRGIWEDGWKAVTVHAPITGKGHFDQDQWELYHVDVDRSESKDLAKEYPEKLEALIKAWFEEAGQELRAAARRPHRVGDHLTIAASLGRSRRASATSTTRTRRRCRKVWRSTCAAARTRSSPMSRSPIGLLGGVIFAHGSRFGGHTLFIKDKKLLLRLQLPGHQAGAAVRLDANSSPASTRSAWSSPARAPASTTSRSARPSSTSTTRSSRKAR